MTTETINWHRVADGLPDASTTVLMAVQDADGIEVYQGFYEGSYWHDASAWLIRPPQVVTAWADMPEGPK
jgi:hypothetical protein